MDEYNKIKTDSQVQGTDQQLPVGRKMWGEAGQRQDIKRYRLLCIKQKNKDILYSIAVIVYIPIPKKGNAKECSNYCIIALISHASKVILKIFQARLQQCMNNELSDVQDAFRKCRGTRHQIADIHWIIEKARVPEKQLLLY